MPSPEQGPSKTIKSKYSLKTLANLSELSLVTTTFLAPKRSTFSTKILLRLLEISLLTKTPVLFI